MSDATSLTKGGRSYTRKRVRRTRDQARNDSDGRPNHPLDVSCQASPVASSTATQKSEKISNHEYFTLKTIALKVVYYFTFSQDLLPLPQNKGQDKTITPTANTLNHFLLILECVRHRCHVRQCAIHRHKILPLTLSQHGGRVRN